MFIRNSDGEVLIGNVWPGNTSYPDFFAPNVVSWWTRQFKKFHDQINFDGIWIDMNEVDNFYTGSSIGCPKNRYLYLNDWVCYFIFLSLG